MREPINKEPGSSFVTRCVIEAKPGEGPIFDQRTVPGHVIARLDGYAIIPMERYKELTGIDLFEDGNATAPAGVPTASQRDAFYSEAAKSGWYVSDAPLTSHLGKRQLPIIPMPTPGRR